MKTKLILFVTVLAAALFGVGCASPLKEGLVVQYSFDGDVKNESEKGALVVSKGAQIVDGVVVVGEKGSVLVNVGELPDGNAPRTFSIWVKSEEAFTGSVMIARWDTENIDEIGKDFGFSYRNT
ncbi:MAG: hypothetical protein MK236_00440, partial [Pedosphaera sp.]|nr:hypothetical protein [Pedosphaera sp.]